MTKQRFSLMWRIKSTYQSALADADQALALTANVIDMAHLHAEALRAKGDNLYRLGRLHLAINWLTKSLQAYTHLGNEARAMTVVMELGLSHCCKSENRCTN